jgi:hypothetical protein
MDGDTRDTAWSFWRQAQGGGHAVSNGGFPCHENWTRRYGFNGVLVCGASVRNVIE